MSASPRSSVATARNSCSFVAVATAHGSSANSSNALPRHRARPSVKNARRSNGEAVRAFSQSSENLSTSSSPGPTTSRYPVSVVSTRLPSDFRNRDTAVRTTEPSVRPSAMYWAIRSDETVDPSAATRSAISRRNCGVRPTGSPLSSQISIRPRIPNLTSTSAPSFSARSSGAVTVASR